LAIVIESPRPVRCLLILVLAVVVSSADLQAQQEGSPAAAEMEEVRSDDPGLFRKFFITLGRGVARLPSKENRPILLTGAMLAAAAYPLDDELTTKAAYSRFLKVSFGGYGKALGEEWIQGGSGLAGYVVGRIWNKPRLTAASGDLIEAQLLAVALTQGLKFAIGRTRPDGEARSFPSGHASASFATASTLQRHFGRRAAIPAYAIAAYTSVSRLQANSHYASDVIAGAALGIAIGRTATIGVARRRVQVAPVPIDGGFAVVVTPTRD
jgi:membrane-associated phospholipid phosphatase